MNGKVDVREGRVRFGLGLGVGEVGIKTVETQIVRGAATPKGVFVGAG